MRRARSRAGRRRQLRGTGGRLSGEPGREGLAARARSRAWRRACRAISSTASPRCPTSRCCRRRKSTPSKAQGGILEAIRWRRTRRRGDTAADPPPLSLHRRGAEHRLALGAPTSRSTSKGFVRTGSDLAPVARPLETSRDGIFAIGDVRAGSTKRVAAAVGEGAQVISTIHAHLADSRDSLAKAERGEVLMADQCAHVSSTRRVTPSAPGCEERLAIGSPWRNRERRCLALLGRRLVHRRPDVRG